MAGPGPARASAGHTSLTLYIQLFLSGYGLEIGDLEALRTWGSKTPGHPEYWHTRGVEITTGPLTAGNAGLRLAVLPGPTLVVLKLAALDELLQSTRA